MDRGETLERLREEYKSIYDVALNLAKGGYFGQVTIASLEVEEKNERHPMRKKQLQKQIQKMKLEKRKNKR
ncbi:hypothetical protein FLK61_34185 [Paenalkalicoccus suaedae]|uniref:Uncharacterized protein n=1 Tax=Paenalkalicoccus suaedae TaxID=2592382 RepID=A0A859FFX8_9BACI|nr:hypothetical protein [Paenalkalicoccus suaedae]QKS71676.1 hypothetical protein FLK61_33890 [Paenalkalicoccus suaedae]QKS71728.1 hypothetical protein FLK61_34185 [Paenalkalicoccus suaedae]